MARPANKTRQKRRGFGATTLRKLEDAFGYGLSNKQACLLANISESLFYEVCANNEQLSERFKVLKEQPKIAAIKTIVSAIQAGDTKLACWYLERKNWKEFHPHHVSRKHPDERGIDLVLEGKKRSAKYEKLLAKWVKD